MEDQQQRNIFGLTFSENLKSDLGSTAVWAKVAAIISFVNIAVSLALSFITGSYASAIVGAIISFLLALYLYRFSESTIRGVTENNQLDVNEGLNNLSVYFKIYGVICILVLVLIIMALLIVVLTGLIR